MSNIENTPPAPEVSPAPPVQAENPPPTDQAAPPAARLVADGEVTDVRALALQRREEEIACREALARDVETNLANRELTLQQREAIIRATVPAPSPAKLTRKRNWSDPITAAEEIDIY